MTYEKVKDYIDNLANKASMDYDSGNALRFSQAACNLANAMCALDAASKPKRVVHEQD